MKTRFLKNDDELRIFSERFQERGNPVNIDYLKSARVRGFFNSKGEMFAGYALNTHRPLRYEGWIPEEERANIPLLSSKTRLAELTCIWIYAKQGRISSERIYLRAVLDGLASGAGFVLGGTLSPIVFGIQSQSLTQMVYSGPTSYFGKQQRCWVYGASRMELIRRIFTSFPATIVKKTFGKRSYLAEARMRARAVTQETV